MNPFKTLLFAAVSFCFAITVSAQDKPHAVIIVGTHHYTPQKSMPVFAAELERLGFETTVINPDWDPEKDKRGLPGLEALGKADVAVFFTRFLKLENEQLKHITDYVESGNPVVGFRTSTHGFNYPENHPNHDLNNSFGRDVLGTPYQIHLTGKTDVSIVEGAEEHPILTGIEPGEWESPGTLYLTKLQPGTKPLLMGTGNSKPGVRKNAFGTFDLKAEMTDVIAWTWENKWKGRVFTTSLGHMGDFENPRSMRVMVNGVFWAADQPVPSADTEIKVSGEKPQDKKNEASAETAPSEKFTILYGNSLVERLQEDGTFEALMQAATPNEKLRFRSLAYSGDEVTFRMRPEKFSDHLNFITSQLPAERVMMCFGMNESFAGAEGLAEFRKNLDSYLSLIADRHPGSKQVLVSPTAVEKSETLDDEATEQRNTDIKLYTDAMREIAGKRGIDFVDLYTPTSLAFASGKDSLTTNGLHPNTAGIRLVAELLAGELISPEHVSKVKTTLPGFESLRELVSRKAYEVAMAYHPANGIHYYGLRGRSYEYQTEIPHHLKLADLLDKEIWKQASDLTKALPIPKLPTAIAEPPSKQPRRGLGVIRKTPEQDLADFEVADGFDVNLFASSADFPELINPLQIQFDAKGRLWVITFESYPVPVPGTLANDKVLILEDTDGDGRADKSTVFAEGLKLPDGFVFYKNGIVVSVARKFLWIRDHDGDDKADETIELLRGADDTDTHHGGYLARDPQGKIIINEALFHRGQMETPHGVVRTRNAAALSFDVETQKLVIERQTSQPNPWKISFNTTGDSMQMFGGGQIIDCDYYNIWTPAGTHIPGDMGAPFRDDKGCTLTYVSGTHFPEDWQGGLLTGHLLGRNAVMFTPLAIENGVQSKAGDHVDLLTSSNKVFRPTDLEFGLDGALYVSDFYYPIIGHAQHSIRDKNRDYHNGRIWRVTKTGAPLAEKPEIENSGLKELFDLFTHPQVRVRELIRHELEKRDTSLVMQFVKDEGYLEKGMEDEELGLELLWLFERNKDYSAAELFRKLLSSENLPIRRAAARSLRWWAPSMGDEAKTIATELLKSDDERTKIAVISSASHLQHGDPYWTELIDSSEAAPGTPFEKVVNVAQLHSRTPIAPEFPLLKVSPNAKLNILGMEKGETSGAIFLMVDEPTDALISYEKNPSLSLQVNGIPLLWKRDDVHSGGGQLNASFVAGLNAIEFQFDPNAKRSPKTVTLYLTDMAGNKPEGVGFASDTAEHNQWEETYNKKYATVTDEHIYIKTIPSALEFNVKTFTVKAGKTYDFIFENPDHMLHNIVITKPGKAEAVGEMADTMASSPDAMAKHYIPETDLILFATEQTPYEGKVTKQFTTPEEPGKYPFICTFPGHWRLMRGVMIVE